MKKILATILITVICFSVNAQTNVSGGVYTNTTWSLTGSPYIITDTVVVFPGVTLTIQPGVTVKFNSGKQLEIRQAALVALGTNTDSITFTSNTSLTAGSWNTINLNGGTMTSKFNYCNFRYATAGISDNRGGAGDTIIIKNSTFIYNTTGLLGQGTSYGIIDTSNFKHNSTGASTINGTALNNCNISNNVNGLVGCKGGVLNNCTINHNQSTGLNGMNGSTVNNCIVSYNQSGINITGDVVNVKNTIVDSNSVVGISISSAGDSIFNCQITNNGIGLRSLTSTFSYPNSITKNSIVNNSTGIELHVTNDNIYCNKICSNTTYDLQYLGSTNISVTNNFWCTVDSASTETVIYDGYDNVNYGLVKFMPIDNTCNSTTGIANSQLQTVSFNVFPNPASNNLTIQLPETISKTEVKIFNLLGDLEYSSTVIGQKKSIDISSFSSGIYFIEIEAGINNGRQKFIKE